MRLIDIYELLDNITNKEEINIRTTDMYWGDIKLVLNFWNIKKIIELLDWEIISVDDEINTILKSNNDATASMSLADFSTFEHYVTVTLKDEVISFYKSVNLMLSLQGWLDKQEENTINIKIPSKKINTFKELNAYNNRLDKLFKQFNIDGAIKLNGFDSGTDWYNLLISWQSTYIVFTMWLSIAYWMVKIRQSYYEWWKAKLEYQALLDVREDKSKISDKDIEIYIDKKIENEVKVKLVENLEEIWKLNTVKTPDEISNQLCMAIIELMKEISSDTEFHLSYNLPEYIEQSGNDISIDYSFLSKKNEGETLELPDWNDENDNEELEE